MSHIAVFIYPPPVCISSTVLVSGDNFYTEGVQSTTDERWDTLWREVETHWHHRVFACNGIVMDVQVYLEPYSNLNVPW